MSRFHRWYSLALTVGLFFSLSGCLLHMGDEEGEELEEAEQVDRVRPTVQLSDRLYAGVAPLMESPTSHLINEQLGSYRLDRDRFELGLIERAAEYFPPEEHLFVGGQLITRAEATEWLKAAHLSDESLNPADAPSVILQHILEHNYLDLNGQDLKGVVVGLSLVSSYEVERDDGSTQTMYYTADQLRNYGFEIADKLVERLRSKAADVPIVVALYQLEEKEAYHPGGFLSIGYVKPNEQAVGEWQSIDELYFLFPSAELSHLNSQLASTYQRLVERVQDFFPRYVGVVGIGRFLDEELVELNLDVTTEFASVAEAIQLTQYIGVEAMEAFAEHIYINIYVGSVNEQKAIFSRPPGGEPMIHIYR